MTQDTTPLGRPIVKALLLHSTMSVGSEQGVVGKIRTDSFPRMCPLALEPYLVRSGRALKINRGGVLSCVTYGITTAFPERKAWYAIQSWSHIWTYTALLYE